MSVNLVKGQKLNLSKEVTGLLVGMQQREDFLDHLQTLIAMLRQLS